MLKGIDLLSRKKRASRTEADEPDLQTFPLNINSGQVLALPQSRVQQLHGRFPMDDDHMISCVIAISALVTIHPALENEVWLRILHCLFVSFPLLKEVISADIRRNDLLGYYKTHSWVMHFALRKEYQSALSRVFPSPESVFSICNKVIYQIRSTRLSDIKELSVQPANLYLAAASMHGRDLPQHLHSFPINRPMFAHLFCISRHELVMTVQTWVASLFCFISTKTRRNKSLHDLKQTEDDRSFATYATSLSTANSQNERSFPRDGIPTLPHDLSPQNVSPSLKDNEREYASSGSHSSISESDEEVKEVEDDFQPHSVLELPSFALKDSNGNSL